MPLSDEVIFVAGHRGMVGSAIVRSLLSSGHDNIVTADRRDLDLLDQSAVKRFLKEKKVTSVYLAAAKVGGIYANNTFPAEFIYENIAIQNNVIHASHLSDIDRLLFLGSSCIYPKHAPQPIPENALLTGLLEQTNEPYAIAKIAGIKTCESYNRQYGRRYRSVMPTNLYGTNDNFHLENAHVLPALMRKFHEAREAHKPSVTVWGTGRAMREFLHVDDMARACLFVMNLEEDTYTQNTHPTLSHINVGTGRDCTIFELATLIASTVDYKGRIEFDINKPDGTPRKLLDVSRLKAMGWQSQIALEDGLASTYSWFMENKNNLRTEIKS